jgi:hypothetical protein
VWIGTPDADALAQAQTGATLLQIPADADQSPASTPTGVQIEWPPPMQRVGSGRTAHLDAPLSPDALPLLLSAQFPASLHSVLFDLASTPARAPAESVRPMRVEMEHPTRETPLRSSLASLIALLFLLERLLASARRAGSAA